MWFRAGRAPVVTSLGCPQRRERFERRLEQQRVRRWRRHKMMVSEERGAMHSAARPEAGRSHVQPGVSVLALEYV